MAQFYTTDIALKERLQKEFGFKVVGMSGKPTIYLFAEDESVVKEKLRVSVILEKKKDIPVETPGPIATFFKHRGRPKNK